MYPPPTHTLRPPLVTSANLDMREFSLISKVEEEGEVKDEGMEVDGVEEERWVRKRMKRKKRPRKRGK